MPQYSPANKIIEPDYHWADTQIVSQPTGPVRPGTKRNERIMKPILSNIRINASASEETPCFTAVLTVHEFRFSVSNNGRGGANDYCPPLSSELERELDQWAAENNPPIAECGGVVLTKPMAYNFETWTFEKAFELCVS